MKCALLSPAGSFLCLKAAVKAGADAVYFGVGDTNARCYADNFTSESAAEAIRYCRFHGVETDVALNISVYDRELPRMLATAESLWKAGADAFIVADLGLAAEMKKRFPEIVLHASTQAMGHSVGCAEYLRDAGFSRMVLARELSLDDIAVIAENSPIESEVFIHGACCASASGSCLMSAAVGGRSGNRGKCAGPCRLPYRMEGKEGRLLSLADLCFAGHIKELKKLNIAALKIEGRMKPPEYVYGVTRIYRTLLDEDRNAGAEDLRLLQSCFSRPFSDGYPEGRCQPLSGDPVPAGTVSAETTPEAEKDRADGFLKRRSAAVSAVFAHGRPFSVTAVCGDHSFTAEGRIPEEAKNAPLTAENIIKQLKKTGDLPFECSDARVTAEPLFLPVSELNETRRRALSGLYDIMTAPPARTAAACGTETRKYAANPDRPAKYAFYTLAESVTERAEEFFDRIYLPAEEVLKFEPGGGAEICVSLPFVIHPSEEEDVLRTLDAAAKRGISRAAVYNYGHIALARRAGFSVLADIGCNVFNETTAEVIARSADEVSLSPELGIGALSDICSRVPAGYTVYGRLPLMILQSCIIRTAVGCAKCTEARANGNGFFYLRDRTGTDFPVRGSGHRSVLYNSVPIYMGDRTGVLPECAFRAWRFVCESGNGCDRVISMFKNGQAPDRPCMRIQKYNLEARNDR